MRMLTAHIGQQPLRGVALAVVLPRPVALQNRLRRQGKHLPLLRMHQHRAQQLMVIRGPPIPVAFLAATIAMHLRGGEIPRAVHTQQVMTAQAGEPLQALAPLKRREHALERPPQHARVHLIEPFPQRRVRRRPSDPVQTLQVRTNQCLVPGVAVELQQRGVLQTEDRQPRHQTVREVQTPSGHGVLDAVEAGADLAKQSRGAQSLAESIVGHDS